MRSIGPEAATVLEKLTHFDPSRRYPYYIYQYSDVLCLRWSLHELLISDLFVPMRKDVSDADFHQDQNGIYYTYYSALTKSQFRFV